MLSAVLRTAAPLLLLALVAAAGDCPAGKWQRYGDSCYVLLAHLFRSQAEATADCARLQPGASLPSVHSHEQNEFVLDMALNAEYGDIWLGLERVNATAGFRWQDGSQIDYVNWLGDEPDGTGDCVYVDFWTSQWRDVNCDTAHFFVVCQYIPE